MGSTEPAKLAGSGRSPTPRSARRTRPSQAAIAEAAQAANPGRSARPIGAAAARRRGRPAARLHRRRRPPRSLAGCPCSKPSPIGLAGLAAGTINTVVGSGTLITFPTLLAFGVPPVTANVSNTIGLVPGSVSGVVGYRRELEGQRARVLRLGVASLLGGLAGRRAAAGAARRPPSRRSCRR